ncbi:glycosyltransferase [Halovivax limisalsi]|uniref:glycosyltransferase n=1 Tax=Halovivax limisalsi TaxID=1453760 RepID=UPI001FFD4E0E|nr:glycosyltransferase [Halovivax limisalsi]
MNRTRSPRRRSLVYFVSTRTAGGAQTGMVRLLDGLDPERWDVTVASVTSADTDVGPELPDRAKRIDLDRRSPVRGPIALYRAVADADVLVCSLYHATIVGRLLSTLAGVSVVNWHHSVRFANGLRERCYLATAGLSDRILADSPAVATVLDESYGLGEKVSTVPIAGIDLEEFRPTTHAAGDELRVVTVGSLVPAKRHRAVLEAARVLDEREGAPSVSVTIAGSGELAADLRQRRDALGLQRVSLPGHVDDVPALLREHDIYLHTAAYEGLCLAALEAMACELPVVSTRVGGPATYVEDGRSGYLLDEADPHAIADAIRRLSDPDRRREFGGRGREIVENGYSQAALVSAFESAIEACLDGNERERVDGRARVEPS